MYRSIFSTLLTLLFFISTINAQASGGLNLLQGDSPSKKEFSTPEFLKVDQAFKFSSEMTNNGLKLIWDIADDYYLYKERFKFKTEQAGVTLGKAQFSTNGKEKEDPYFGKVHIIKHQLEVFLPILLAEGQTDTEIKISYQGCAEAGLCYPPKHQYLMFIASDEKPAPYAASEISPLTTNTTSTPEELDLEDASGIFDFLKNSSLPLIIGIFFLLGLGLTFTPCVFPMIPIITSIIAGQKSPSMLKSLALSSAYVIGMAITYASAGVITGLLGASANIQAALQDPYLLSVFSIISIAPSNIKLIVNLLVNYARRCSDRYQKTVLQVREMPTNTADSLDTLIYKRYPPINQLVKKVSLCQPRPKKNVKYLYKTKT